MLYLALEMVKEFKTCCPQVTQNEVQSKTKKLPAAYETYFDFSHTIPSSWIFVINIIKLNLDWKNYQHD